jgi:hypothetical protein
MTAKPKLSPQDMDRLSSLYFQLAHNDKTRAGIAQLTRHVDPEAAKAFSDVFLDQRFAAFRKELNDQKLQEQVQRAAGARDAEKQQIIRERGYDENQVKQLEALQTQYGFTSWKAAADIYAYNNPGPGSPNFEPPPPQYLDGSTWEFPTVPGSDGKEMPFKEFIQNPRKAANDHAYRMIHGFKMGKGLPDPRNGLR